MLKTEPIDVINIDIIRDLQRDDSDDGDEKSIDDGDADADADAGDDDKESIDVEHPSGTQCNRAPFNILLLLAPSRC